MFGCFSGLQCYISVRERYPRGVVKGLVLPCERVRKPFPSPLQRHGGIIPIPIPAVSFICLLPLLPPRLLQCEERSAEWECEKCEEVYCTKCYKKRHSRSKFQYHVPRYMPYFTHAAQLESVSVCCSSSFSMPHPSSLPLSVSWIPIASQEQESRLAAYKRNKHKIIEEMHEEWVELRELSALKVSRGSNCCRCLGCSLTEPATDCESMAPVHFPSPTGQHQRSHSKSTALGLSQGLAPKEGGQ